MKLLRRNRPNRGPQVREWSSSAPASERADAAREDGEREPNAPMPQPERHEAHVADPGLTDLSLHDYKAILIRAGKGAWENNVMDVAAALAYRFFTAIPALLLVLVGSFSVAASPKDVTELMARLEGVIPAEAIALLEDSLTRTVVGGGGRALIGIGALVAFWTATSAMTALIRGLNVVYGREETRGFVRQRLIALAMLASMLVALALVFGLLVLGPVLSGVIGSALGLEGAFEILWWTAQWPILIGGLLLAFSAILYLGPNFEERYFRFLTLGATVALVLWLAGSGLFALYVSNFGSYNKAWGSLAAVIIMLTWLWLSSLALLLGGAINAEARRSRELRQGLPAEENLQGPAKT